MLIQARPESTKRASSPIKKLSPRAKAGLNAVRAFAAIYVVVYHVAQAHGPHGILGAPLRFGQEAVIIFFLLSGFVIFANESQRTNELGGYYIRRIRRIYPPLLGAMALGVVVALFNHDLSSSFRLGDLLGTLFNVQDVAGLKPGVMTSPFMGNVPLWSLSYEMVFYLVFPLLMILWHRSERGAMHAVGAFSVCCYLGFIYAPNHFLLVFSYLLIWWCGALAAAAYQRGSMVSRPALGGAGWMCVLCSAAFVGIAVRGWHGAGYYPGLMLRHFAFALFALLLALTPLARLACDAAFRVRRQAAYLASISYGLYVFHYPLVVEWQASNHLSGLVVALSVLVMLAVMVDRRLDRALPKPGRKVALAATPAL